MKDNSTSLPGNTYSIKELIDIDQLQKTLETFSAATGFTTTMMSHPEQETLIAIGQREICAKFYRAHPASEAHCKKSDIRLTEQLDSCKLWDTNTPTPVTIETCENGLARGATPIIIDGKHLASFTSGQVLFEKPDVKRFKKQAEAYGYDMDAYLDALGKVPVVTRQQFASTLSFLSELARLLAETGLKNLKLKDYAAKLESEITYRKHMEDALQKEREFNKTLFKTTPAFVVAIDAEGKTVMMNDAMRNALGYASHEIEGVDYLTTFVPERDREALAKVFETLSTSKESTVNENYVIARNGRELLVEWHGSPVFNTKEEFEFFFGVGIDITERKRAEEALRKERGLNETLFKTTPAFVVAIDAEGKTVMMNDAMCNALGYSFHEIKGVDYLSTFVPERDREKLAKIFETLCTSREPAVTENYVVTRKGRELLVEWRGSQVFNAKDEFEFFFGVGIDITERERAEAEREKLIVELEAKNAELERFTYTVSHDLKSPLITTKGFIGMLKQDLAEGNQELIAEDIQRISHAAEIMERLLEELLELSRIGRIVNPPEKILLSDLAKEAVSMLSGEPNTPNIDFVIAPDLPVVYGDRIRLREVLQNLIENSIKFMADQTEPRIEIGYRQEKEKTIFYVRDNGIGIEPRYHEKIFGLFDKLHCESAGTGIGLAIVKRIVEVHNGRIWVESEGTGHGSTFCFTLEKHEKEGSQNG